MLIAAKCQKISKLYQLLNQIDVTYIEELIHIPYMITSRTDKTKSLFKDLKPYRVKQFYKALLQGNIDSFLCITTLSKDIRTKIDKNIPFLRYKDFRTVGDKRDLSYKAGLILLDDREIETVLMRNKMVTLQSASQRR